MLSRRQINVQKQNLVAMCRISVKSLLDYACLYSHVDDDCEEFINFCAVFEQMVSHRLRPYQKKVWLPGHGSPRHFWNVLQENHNSSHGAYFQTCIPNIEAIETLKSPKTKLRAFIRVALMEKRLSDYLFWLLDNPSLIRESYFDGAVMTSEEASVLCSDLIGLNAIDFNFCLKGNENELVGPLEINYSPFIKYKQMSASKSVDDLEMQHLSGKSANPDTAPGGTVLTENSLNDFLRLQALEKDFKSIKEQKDYLEELVRLRERQLADLNSKHDSARIEREVRERDMDSEHKTMHACILELQAEMSKLRKQNENLKSQVQYLKSFKERMEVMDVPMIDMASARSGQVKSGVVVEMDRIENRFTMLHQSSTGKDQLLIQSDQSSILSSLSDQTRLKEDTHSMIPLTGSLMDVQATIGEPSSNEGLTSAAENVECVKDSVTCSTIDNSSTDYITYSDVQELKKNVEAEQEQEDVQEAMMQVNVDSKPPSTILVEHHDTTAIHMSAHPAAADGGQPDNVLDSNNSSAAQLEGEQSTLQKPRSASSGASSSGESEREEEKAGSDPEIINKSASSSEGGDNAWDMMSDAEHDNKGAN